jgi:flagellar basal-body rod modification protein FlgD
MEFPTIQQPSAAGGAGDAAKTAAKKDVSQDDFLKLLIAQLQHQDPLNPIESQEFTVQLATFNMLDQMIKMNGNLQTMQGNQAFLGQVGAVSLIGREVTADGGAVNLKAGETAPVDYRLESKAARVTVEIRDGQGRLVRTLEAPSQDAGDQRLLWDGKEISGLAAKPGVYSFEVNAFGPNGNKLGVTARTRGIVTAVDFSAPEPLVKIGDIEIPISAVTGVH